MKTILEYETADGANQVDLKLYLQPKFSERRQCYIFILRTKPKQSSLCDCGRKIE